MTLQTWMRISRTVILDTVAKEGHSDVMIFFKRRDPDVKKITLLTHTCNNPGCLLPHELPFYERTHYSCLSSQAAINLNSYSYPGNTDFSFAICSNWACSDGVIAKHASAPQTFSLGSTVGWANGEVDLSLAACSEWKKSIAYWFVLSWSQLTQPPCVLCIPALLHGRLGLN